jgi:hypothetical protein
MALTDAQLKVLVGDLVAAVTAHTTAGAQLVAAKKALAQGLGAGAEVIVMGRRIRVNTTADDLVIELVRVVA